MATWTSVDPRHLTQLQADVRQLADPIHIAIRGKIITHPCLLDQLRHATIPGRAVKGPERRQVPRSRPPAALDPMDAWSTIMVELSGWHARLRLDSPPRDVDWQRNVLRALPAAASDLAPALADWLAADVAEWWRLAAVHSGWRPYDLRKLR